MLTLNVTRGHVNTTSELEKFTTHQLLGYAVFLGVDDKVDDRYDRNALIRSITRMEREKREALIATIKDGTFFAGVAKEFTAESNS